MAVDDSTSPTLHFTEHLYHALNRGNQRITIFHKEGNFKAFKRVLDEGLQKFFLTSSRIAGYQTIGDIRIFQFKMMNISLW